MEIIFGWYFGIRSVLFNFNFPIKKCLFSRAKTKGFSVSQYRFFWSRSVFNSIVVFRGKIWRADINFISIMRLVCYQTRWLIHFMTNCLLINVSFPPFYPRTKFPEWRTNTSAWKIASERSLQIEYVPHFRLHLCIIFWLVSWFSSHWSRIGAAVFLSQLIRASSRSFVYLKFR